MEYASKNAAKETALDIISEFYRQVSNTFSPSNKMSHWLWTIRRAYDLIAESDRPPLVVLEELMGDIKEYALVNDIWFDCEDAIDEVIDLFV